MRSESWPEYRPADYTLFRASFENVWARNATRCVARGSPILFAWSVIGIFYLPWSMIDDFLNQWFVIKFFLRERERNFFSNVIRECKFESSVIREPSVLRELFYVNRDCPDCPWTWKSFCKYSWHVKWVNILTWMRFEGWYRGPSCKLSFDKHILSLE